MFADKKTRRIFRFFLLFAVFALPAGCAPKNWDTEEDGAFDALEPINRGLYKVHKGVDGVVLTPAAQVYRRLPPPLQKSVGNIIGNLGEPANAVNNALLRQGEASINSFARFTFNTVIGVGGLFDVASLMGVSRRPADFGQTLRAYGLGDTTYIFIPVLGPSSFADGAGRSFDSSLAPMTYVDDDGARVVVYGAGGLHRRAELLDETELAAEAALDEYSFIRDIYEDRRRASLPADVWEF